MEITAKNHTSALVRLADSLQINIDGNWTRDNVLLELHEQLCEHPTATAPEYAMPPSGALGTGFGDPGD